MFVVSIIAFLVVACESKVEPEFLSTNIAGASFGQDFHLVDHAGTLHSLADFKDKVVVIFFGYTQCPDMCPVTMGLLAEAMKQIGNEAQRVQVIFITLDPARDTPDILEQYVTSFDPNFIGLTGNENTIKATAADFKVHSQKNPAGSDIQSVDHSTGTYLFDTQGKIRLYIRYGEGVELFVHDIKALLKAS
ncbi:MAG: SCO family protein [Nitrosomonas sp.]|nr:SCO family protein [Nitrosomonas sp.]